MTEEKKLLSLMCEKVSGSNGEFPTFPQEIYIHGDIFEFRSAIGKIIHLFVCFL